MTVFDDLVSVASPVLIERNLHKQQGASWEVRQPLAVDDVPMDWTGCTATCQVRDAAGALVFTFTTLTLTSVGTLTMSATPTQTAAVPVGTFSYDVDIVNGAGRRLPFMAGLFRVAAQVTT